MKLTIYLMAMITISSLHAKDCHDCSVNRDTNTNNPQISKLEKYTQKVVTQEEEQLRILLCAEAASGLENWKRFEEILVEKKIAIENYYAENKCGINVDNNIMQHAMNIGGGFGYDFLRDFIEYLEKRQESTGDKTIIYRLVNYTYSPERQATILDELQVSGRKSDLKAAKLLKKYGAKNFKELSVEDKQNSYYNKENKVAKK